MYILANDKNSTGYKGRRLTNDTINSYPERIKAIWLKVGIIKEIKKVVLKK